MISRRASRTSSSMTFLHSPKELSRSSRLNDISAIIFTRPLLNPETSGNTTLQHEWVTVLKGTARL